MLNLKFSPKRDQAEIKTTAQVNPPLEIIKAPEIELPVISREEKLCSACEINKPSAKHGSLCTDCIKAEEKNRIGREIESLADSKEEITLERQTTQIPSYIPQDSIVRQLQIVEPSVRYHGKELEDILLAQMPALTEAQKLHCKQLSMAHVKQSIKESGGMSLTELRYNVEVFKGIYELYKELEETQSAKLQVKMKPVLKEIEKERKANEKTNKTNTAVRKLTNGNIAKQHTMHEALKPFVEITAPPDASIAKELNKFLDHVQVEKELEGELSGAFIQSLLRKPKFVSLSKYFKFK